MRLLLNRGYYATKISLTHDYNLHTDLSSCLVARLDFVMPVCIFFVAEKHNVVVNVGLMCVVSVG